MSTTPAALYPSYYNPTYTGQTVPYLTGNNLTQAAQNQRAVTQSQANELESNDQDLANEYAQQQAGTQQYLNPIEQSNASGQGGYTPGQASQIELTPQQEANIATNAGISAGAGNASAVGAAERATDAAGGNPAALAAYRARAAQSQAANAGQASTGAQVAAQQAGSAGAQAVGNTQIAQENQGLSYLGNLQAQQGSSAQNEQGLGQSAFGTATTGTGQALNSEISASGVPTGFDKLTGAVAGAAPGVVGGLAAAGALADGSPGYLDDGGQDAVVGENGTEAIIENEPEAVLRAASDPVRSHTRFMDAGGIVPGSPAMPGAVNWLQQYLAQNNNQPQPTQQQPQQQWNKTTPYSQIGQAVGKIAGIAGAYRAAHPANDPNQPNGPYGPQAFAPGSSQMPMGPDVSTGTDLGAGAADVAAPATDTAIGAFGDLAADGRPPMSGPMMADGETAPEQSDYLDDPENSSDIARFIATQGIAASGNPTPYTAEANGRMGGAFHWSSPKPPMPETPRQLERANYQPLAYRAKPMLADGAAPIAPAIDPAFAPSGIGEPTGQPGATPPNGSQVGSAKVFNQPTMVHLDKGDTVVPLTYRPKAKVRPSSALPALKVRAHPRRPMYGARHAA